MYILEQRYIPPREKRKKMNISGVSAADITANNQPDLVGGASDSQKTGTDVLPEITNDEKCNSSISSDIVAPIEQQGHNSNANIEMSTQDFMSLRESVKDDPFEALDHVIARMKENMEEVGDAMEVMAEMTKKTSKENLALQLLQKTLEAMEENE